MNELLFSAPQLQAVKLHFAPGENKSEMVFYRSVLEPFSLCSALCAPKHRQVWDDTLMSS